MLSFEYSEKPVANWHTHTERCKHAIGNVYDYCKAAVDAGLSVLGISDHTPTPDSRWRYCRMEISELDNYIFEIKEAQKKFPELEIHTGLECEWLPQYEVWYKEELLGRLGIEYLILGVHYAPSPFGGMESPFDYTHSNDARFLSSYVKYWIQAIESGLFAFAAHPDLFGNFCTKWNDDFSSASRDMIQCAKALDIPLEVNTNGFRKPKIYTEDSGVIVRYPRRQFWEMALEENCRMLINSDAHKPSEIIHGWDDAVNFINEIKL